MQIESIYPRVPVEIHIDCSILSIKSRSFLKYGIQSRSVFTHETILEDDIIDRANIKWEITNQSTGNLKKDDVK